MTADELARSYFNRSAKRWLALEVLMQHDAFPDVVREAQEIVELVLKGMLRAELADFATISRRLRRDREAAFYGDTDLIPEQVFDRSSAQQALDDARRVLAGVPHFLGQPG